MADVTHVTYDLVIERVKTLPPDKLPSLFSFVEFLQSPYSAYLSGYGPLSDDELTRAANDLFVALDQAESANASTPAR